MRIIFVNTQATQLIKTCNIVARTIDKMPFNYRIMT